MYAGLSTGWTYGDQRGLRRPATPPRYRSVPRHQQSSTPCAIPVPSASKMAWGSVRAWAIWGTASLTGVSGTRKSRWREVCGSAVASDGATPSATDREPDALAPVGGCGCRPIDLTAPTPAPTLRPTRPLRRRLPVDRLGGSTLPPRSCRFDAAASMLVPNAASMLLPPLPVDAPSRCQVMHNTAAPPAAPTFGPVARRLLARRS
jgi:hypothetical protein